MFSKACEYGIRASILIASESVNGNRLGLITIAKKIDSPEAFTSKIKLVDIILAIDGEVLKQCSLGLSDCSEVRPCPFHGRYKPIKEKLLKLYSETSLKDLIDGVLSGKSFLKIN